MVTLFPQSPLPEEEFAQSTLPTLDLPASVDCVERAVDPTSAEPDIDASSSDKPGEEISGETVDTVQNKSAQSETQAHVDHESSKNDFEAVLRSVGNSESHAIEVDASPSCFESEAKSADKEIVVPPLDLTLIPPSGHCSVSSPALIPPDVNFSASSPVNSIPGEREGENAFCDAVLKIVNFINNKWLQLEMLTAPPSANALLSFDYKENPIGKFFSYRRKKPQWFE